MGLHSGISKANSIVHLTTVNEAASGSFTVQLRYPIRQFFVRVLRFLVDPGVRLTEEAKVTVDGSALTVANQGTYTMQPNESWDIMTVHDSRVP